MPDKFVKPLSREYKHRDIAESEELVVKRKENLKATLLGLGIPRRDVAYDDVKRILQNKKNNVSLDAISHVYAKNNSIMFRTIDELVEGYILERHHVFNTLQSLKQEVRDIYTARGHATLYKDKYRDDSSSKLLVRVQNILGLEELNAYGKYRVHMDFGSQTIETRSMRAVSGNIDYNELFVFDTTNNDDIEGSVVFSIKDVESGDTICKGEVGLQELRDQEHRILQVAMEGSASPTLTTEMQWLHNKSELHGQHAQKYKDREQELALLIRDQNKKLAAYDKPFDPTKKGFKGVVKGIYGGNLAADGMDNILENFGLTNTQKASQVFVTLFLFFVTFTSYARAMFLDQLVALLAFFFNMDARRWTVKKYKNCTYALCIAMFFDTWWIYYYLFHWGGKSAEVQFVQLTRIFTIVNFVWRILLIIFFWKCGRDYEKNLKKNDMYKLV